MSQQTTIAVLLILVISFIFVLSWLLTSSHNQQQRKPRLQRTEYKQLQANVSSFPSLPLPCDEECLRFGRLLDVWPANKPKAAVVMLVKKSPKSKIAQSLLLFGANFNDAYKYPVIVFHEENMNNEADRQRLRSYSNSSLYFQVVHLQIPHFINRARVSKKQCYRDIGYRSMCRFHAKSLYEQPIVARLQYIWRLDDDSLIMRPVGYDVFKLMQDRGIQYGFTLLWNEHPRCIVGLWEAVTVYMKQRTITQKFQLPRYRIFFNNFELSDLDVWRSTEYRDYIDYIDKTGGIYYHRWGDAPIKTIAVTLFISKDRTYKFSDIAYRHY